MSSSSSRAPATRGGAAGAAGCTDPNTTFVQADPATFRALVQRLTGAPEGAAPASVERQQVVAGPVFSSVPLPLRRPKLQERRRAAPARLELARPQPFYHHHHHQHHHHHHHGLMQYSPVSTMDYARAMAVSSSSPSPSPHSSCSCGVVISKEEEEREEKAIASKSFYLHSSPRSTGGDADERPKLLPLFPVHSPRNPAFA